MQLCDIDFDLWRIEFVTEFVMNEKKHFDQLNDCSKQVFENPQKFVRRIGIPALPAGGGFCQNLRRQGFFNWIILFLEYLEFLES